MYAVDLEYIKSEQGQENYWYQDCGATQNMTSHKSWMKNYTELKQPVMVMIGDATEMEGIGTGDVYLQAFNGQEWEEICLKNVLHIPKMPFNLFSVTKMLDKGYEQTANAKRSVFKTANKKKTVAVASRDGNLFKMMFKTEKSENCLVTVSIKTWHERLVHQNVKYVRDTLNRNKIKYLDDWNDYVCEGCAYGKHHRASHPTNPKTESQTLDVIHVDLCEINILSLGGAKYFLLFKDDFSYYRTAYFLRTKDEAASKLSDYIKLVENQLGKKIKCLKSDNGLEIKNINRKTLLDDLGILHCKSNAYTPQQNGRIEWEMCTVVEAARTAIHAKELSQNLWAEALNYAVFTLNKEGTSSVPNKS